MLKILFILIISLLIPNQFRNMPIDLIQPNNEILSCLITGDEFSQRLHDANDYTIIQSKKDGYYYYATKNADTIIPTSFKALSVNPSDKNIIPGIKISKDKYLRIRDRYHRDVELRDAPSVGTINNLNVFIRFADEDEFSEPRSIHDHPFNKEEGPSMRHYFKEVSYNLLDVITHHYPQCDLETNLSYQDQYDRDYYKPYNENTNPEGYQNNNEARIREHTLLKNAIEYIANEVPEDLDIDSNDDGYIDNVTFLISGSPTGWSDLLWPHRWALYSFDVYINGSRVYDYNLNLDQGGYFTVGTLCHEFFHSLGAPDLYHYYDDVAPVAVGGWDVMDASSDIPQSMSAYMKYRYTDWITSLPQVEFGGTYQINPLSSNENNIYRINSPFSDTEYFVVEYRVKEGIYEINTPGDDNGLLIYRINTEYNGNANGPPDGVYLYRYGGTLNSSGSFGAAVFSQETGRSKFNDTTNPSCFLTDNSNGGINISYVGEDLETIEFSVTNLILVPELNNVSYDSDQDGNINPGEEIIIDLAISNFSDGINANNIEVTLSSSNNIVINNPVVTFNNTLLYNDTFYSAYVINIDEDIPLGNIDLTLDITADYIENNQNLTFEDQSSFTFNVNLLQQGFPFYTSSQVSGSPTVIDLNQDGENEIYFADYTGFIRVLDSQGNEIETNIFPFQTGSQVWGTPAISDINNDGDKEIIFTSKDKKIYAFSYSNLLFEYDASSWLIGTPAIGNIDDDDELEIIIGGFSSSNKKLYAINHDGSDVDNFPLDINEKIQKGVALYDFNNNGKEDIAFGTESNHLYLVYDNATIAPGFPFLADGKFRVEPIIISHNDEPMIISGSNAGTLYAVDTNGNLVFNYATNYEITTSPSIHLINNQPYIIFGNLNGSIYAIDLDGNLHENFPLQLDTGIVGSILFADLNNDNNDEMVILDDLGFLTIIQSDFSTYQHTPIEYDFAFSSSPSIEDIDLDGDLEILAGTVNSVYITDIKQLSELNDSWNTFKGNYKRNGLFIHNSCNPGDMNADSIFNVIDIIAIVNLILSEDEPSLSENCTADLNFDGQINIQDIISLINIILNN